VAESRSPENASVIRHASLSPVAWTPNGDIEYPNWLLEGRRIGAIGRGSPWWVGDWLHYGTTRWGERYLEAVKVTGYDSKSLRNMRYVASRFALSLRRDNLTWSHHALLAAMEPDEHQRWLDRAASNRFSVEDLRIELRSAQRGRYGHGTLGPRRHADGSAAVVALVCPQCGYSATVADFHSNDDAISSPEQPGELG
jgi:hypothetical protein